MAGPFLGGFKILGMAWLSSHALSVRFTTSYGSTYHYQLYAGRSLRGVTSSPLQRRVVGQVFPSKYPQEITLLAVDAAARLTDYGSLLPPRPYNKVKLGWDSLSWPNDAKFIDIVGGTIPGGAVVAGNLLGRIPFDISRTYSFTTKPLSGSGLWNFEVQGKDDKLDDGNAGTALAMNETVIAHPPDVPLNSSGKRFSI